MANVIKIENLLLPQLACYTNLTAGKQHDHANVQQGIFIAESIKVIDTALCVGYRPISLLMEEKQLAGQAAGLIERCGDVPVYVGSRQLLSSLTGYALTRGVLCAMQRKELPTAEKLCATSQRIVVLEHLADTTNMGAVFRSAAALGMDAVLLTPGCCDPLSRRSVRVSMGTVLQLPWGHIGSNAEQWPDQGMALLRRHGFVSVAMALSDDSISIDDPVLQQAEKLAVVLGTEGDGLAHHTIASCDYTARIPMACGVDSLNVAAAGAVAFWQLRKR